MSFQVNLEKATAELKAALLGVYLATNEHGANNLTTVHCSIDVDYMNGTVSAEFQAGVTSGDQFIPKIGGSL